MIYLKGFYQLDGYLRFKAQSSKMGSIDEHISCDPASTSKSSKSEQKGTLKDKSTLLESTVHDRGIKETIQKNTNQEIEICEDWSDSDIVEGEYLTWDDKLKLMEEQENEYIKKKVEKLNSALRNWNTRVFNPGMPAKEVEDDTERRWKELFPLPDLDLPNSPAGSFEDFVHGYSPKLEYLPMEVQPEYPNICFETTLQDFYNEDFMEPAPEDHPLLKPKDEDSDDAVIDCPERTEPNQPMMRKLTVRAEPQPQPPSFTSGECCEDSFNEDFKELTLEERLLLKLREGDSDDADMTVGSGI